MQSNADAKPVVSALEARFDRARQTVGLALGPLVGLSIALLPMPSLTPEAHRLACVVGWIVVFWICEPIPIPMSALLGAVLCVVLGVAPARQVFAPFSDPTIYLFLGSFLLAEGMTRHGLHRRFAFFILSLTWIRGRPGAVLFAFGVVAASISMWISNTATTAMMLPIGLGILSVLQKNAQGDVAQGESDRFRTGVMLMAAYAASTGGIGTPVGTPPNLIGIAMIERFAGVRISFFKWMLFAVPILIVLYGVLYLLLRALYKPVAVEKESSLLAAFQPSTPLSAGERNTLIAFAITVVLWITPGVISVCYGATSPLAKLFNDRMPEAVASLIGAGLLFVLPTQWKKREFTLSWKQAAHIDWGTLVLFGGGMALGQMMFQTGLADAVGRGLLSITGADSVWTMTLAAIYISIVMSELASNTASANMIIPVMISLAQAAGINPVPPAIGATLGASWGFMLPVSTPPNAIVYGSGLVPITQMMRAGFVYDLIGGAFIWLGLRVLLPLVGLA